MNFRTPLVTILGLMFALLNSSAPVQAQATRTWVSGVGDDVNPCSRTAPCKTFAGAISKTAAGGEINCLDPGGFGTVTITKSMTIDCSGTFGSSLNSGTNGINVNGAGAVVVLRGLSINGAGTGASGINFINGAQLSVDRCNISGDTSNGINVNVAGGGFIYVTNSYITRVNKGIVATTSAGGILLSVNNVTIANAAASGIELTNGVVASVTASTIASATNAVIVNGSSQIGVDSSTIVNNGTALNASVSGSVIRVSGSNLYYNGTNFNIAAGAGISSTGNNRTTPAGATDPNGTIPLK